MHRLRVVVLTALAAVVACPTAGLAERHVIPTPHETTLYFPGGYAAYRNPSTGEYYESDGSGDLGGDLGIDLGDATGILSYIIFDTGASGSGLVSDAAVDALGLPLLSETFDDIGIGGIETFNVTASLEVMLAFHDDDISTLPNKVDFQSFGNHNLQARQPSASSGGLFDFLGAIEVLGMGVLDGRVMHVEPNSFAELTLSPFIAYSKTTLLNEVPAGVNGLRVALKPVDFINDPTAPITYSTNPMVENVLVKHTDLTSPVNTGEWLLDTGAAVTIVGRDLATRIGIDLDNDVPVTTAQVQGVGAETRNLFGYRLAELVLPLIGGDEMVYEDIIIFVPEDGALPADLPGILGGNLWQPSFVSGADPLSTPELPSPFSAYYIDLANNEMVFVIPEPASGVLLLAACGLAIRRRNRVR